MNEQEDISFIRRHQKAIIITLATVTTVVLAGIIFKNKTATAKVGRYPFGSNRVPLTNPTVCELDPALVAPMNGRGGPIPTTLVVDGIKQVFPSRTMATKSIGGSDGGISLAYSRGQETYLDAIIA